MAMAFHRDRPIVAGLDLYCGSVLDAHMLQLGEYSRMCVPR